ncbi:PLP-dependent aminotransferase family protein [Pseudooceanicola marinus]|uniref:aminotransferase-like domain-containing protein n=1 Tax=Pseudooceanicola marinus TaxID=396013 RepID=UPI001CD1DD4C|nr:PLP-dependent aminotransferase family protein [Pseudooceanicola marinus]MCA1336136.1 PLP-dependent aminotransferase family protein [Pseudooceanicola marinus]
MLTIITRESEEPIQSQLRRRIVESIHSGQMQLGQKMPPSRQLAGQLGIARNTVTAVYEELVARGYLDSVPRRGVFVARDLPPEPANQPEAAPGTGPDWDARLKQRPSRLRHIIKPSNWQDYAFPFVYGQVDPSLFPINTWRTCSRDALGRSAIDWWTADRAVEDDPLLVEQIRTQILPQRGIYAKPEEILITLGTQEGLYLLARLLARPGTRVGCEMPGYPDSRNIMAAEGADIIDLPIDSEGARLPDSALDLAVLTPAHHCPTMVPMSPERRLATLARARRDGTVLIEDDYEGETASDGDQTTLKSLDNSGHVAYLGTLSKVLAPGVRLGFMVAAPALVEEARWLRRLIHRSAPLNNQRTAGIFLAEGHYLALQRSLRAALDHRHAKVVEGCDRYLPDFRRTGTHGGSSVWLECPPGVDARALFTAACARGVLFESGDPFVPEDQAGRFLRLGISYIDERKIDAGLAELGRAVRDL